MPAADRLGFSFEVEGLANTDLRMMDAADTLIATDRAADEPVPSLSDAARRHVAGDLAVKHGLSVERATMLVDRYGAARHALEAAAQTLQARKA